MRSTDRTATAPPIPPVPEGERVEGSPGTRLDPELAGELLGADWEHPWELTPTIHAHARDPLARQISWTREAMIEPYARDAFAVSGEPTALDLNCREGRLSQRLLVWGAKRVVGISADPEQLNRAMLLRKHFAIGPSELDLQSAGGLSESTFGSEFDVIVVTVAPRPERDRLITVAAAAGRGICAIECPDAESDLVAGQALEAGFASVERVAPPLHAAPPYLLGEREILIARDPGAA